MNTYTTRIGRALSRMLFLLLPLLATAPADAAGWASNYGTALATTFTEATAVDASGNVYITGEFDGATLTLGSVTLTRIGFQDAFVAKLDASGTVLWAKNHGGAGARMTAKGIAVDASGSVYLTGYFMSGNLTVPALTRIGQANADAYAIKLDASGDPVWAKNYGGYVAFSGSAFTAGKGIAVDATGSNVYLCGYFANVNLTTPALTRIGDQDAFVFKLDASGDTLWSMNYGGAGGWAQCEDIAVDASGNVYLGGGFSSADLTKPALTRIGSQDAFALKLDAAGNTLWAKNYGGAGATAHVRGIAVDGSGNAYLGGYFEFADLTTPAMTKIGSGDAFALKLNAAGDTNWAKNFGGNGATAYANEIALDANGNIYLGGVFDADLTTPALTLIGDQDAFALKLDTAGDTTWARGFGGIGANVDVNGIAADASDNVHLGGVLYTADLGAPALTRIGENDAVVIKASTIAYPTSFTSPTATNTGNATASVSGGGDPNCGFASAQFVLPAAGTPAGVSFPHGLFDFTLAGCVPGAMVTLAVTYPSAVAAGTQYWKYGPTANDGTDHWYTIPSNVTGATVTFDITDGGLGDDDLTADGAIVDAGGPGVQAQAIGAVAIPALSGWGAMLLAGMLGLFGLGAMKRYPRNATDPS